jgi:hypothetical protein
MPLQCGSTAPPESEAEDQQEVMIDAAAPHAPAAVEQEPAAQPRVGLSMVPQEHKGEGATSQKRAIPWTTMMTRMNPRASAPAATSVVARTRMQQRLRTSALCPFVNTPWRKWYVTRA